MKFDRWETQFFRDVTVLDFSSFVQLKKSNEFVIKDIFVNWISIELTDFPFTHSVAKELEAMADPHPNVLNLASTIFPSSSTSIYIS